MLHVFQTRTVKLVLAGLLGTGPGRLEFGTRLELGSKNLEPEARPRQEF